MTVHKKNAQAGSVERLVRHDRAIVLTAVGLVVIAAGIYTVLGVGMDMSSIEMTAMQPGSSPGGAGMDHARHPVVRRKGDAEHGPAVGE